MVLHLPILLAAVFLTGIAVGYGIRSIISWRRRAEARRRYDARGSMRPIA
jgi:hypothetical protein